TLNLSWSAFQTLMMDATPSSKWGLINGVSAMTFWIGLLVGNALSGILWDSWGMLAPFYASSFAIGLSALLPLLLKETRGKVKRSLNN
ncbi:MAG: MFS transporter, partial [Candidatus Bathyarchaeota archaeon]|nr:MFS transporter [Candidatus Bathyarchaeota archaeon]